MRNTENPIKDIPEEAIDEIMKRDGRTPAIKKRFRWVLPIIFLSYEGVCQIYPDAAGEQGFRFRAEMGGDSFIRMATCPGNVTGQRVEQGSAAL